MRFVLFFSLVMTALACGGKTTAPESAFEPSDGDAVDQQGTPTCFCPAPPPPGRDASDTTPDGSAETDAGSDGDIDADASDASGE